MDKNSNDFKLLKRLILNLIRFHDSTFKIMEICMRNGYSESDIIIAYNDLIRTKQIVLTNDNKLMLNVDLN